MAYADSDLPILNARLYDVALPPADIAGQGVKRRKIVSTAAVARHTLDLVGLEEDGGAARPDASHPSKPSQAPRSFQPSQPPQPSQTSQPSRPRPPADDDDEAEEPESTKRRSRGRPRIDASDVTAADRRRTQIRLAQRAYRNRKEKAIESLEKKVHALSEANEAMTTAFVRLHDFAVERGMLDANPDLAEQLRRTTAVFLEMARQSSADEDAAEPGDDRHAATQSAARPTTQPATSLAALAAAISTAASTAASTSATATAPEPVRLFGSEMPGPASSVFTFGYALPPHDYETSGSGSIGGSIGGSVGGGYSDRASAGSARTGASGMMDMAAVSSSYFPPPPPQPLPAMAATTAAAVSTEPLLGGIIVQHPTPSPGGSSSRGSFNPSLDPSPYGALDDGAYFAVDALGGPPRRGTAGHASPSDYHRRYHHPYHHAAGAGAGAGATSVLVHRGSQSNSSAHSTHSVSPSSGASDAYLGGGGGSGGGVCVPSTMESQPAHAASYLDAATYPTADHQYAVTDHRYPYHRRNQHSQALVSGHAAMGSPYSPRLMPNKYVGGGMSFSARLQHCAAWSAYDLITNPNANAQIFARVFSFCIMHDTVDRIRDRLRSRLELPFGIAINDPAVRLDLRAYDRHFASVNVKPNRNHGPALPPDHAAVAAASVTPVVTEVDDDDKDIVVVNDGANDDDYYYKVSRHRTSYRPRGAGVRAVVPLLSITLPCYDGEFYDCDETEMYLQQRGVYIPPGVDHLFVDIHDDDFALPDMTAGTVAAGIVVPAAMTTTEMTEMTGMTGMTGMNISSDMGGHSGVSSSHTSDHSRHGSRHGGHHGTMPVASFPHVQPPKQRRVKLDVNRFLRELLSRGICIGRSAGFRGHHVNEAFWHSVENV